MTSIAARSIEREAVPGKLHEDAEVDEAVRELLRTLAGGAGGARRPGLAGTAPLVREVRSPDGAWIVRADRLGASPAGGAGAVVVLVEVREDPLPCEDELVGVRGLTRKEAHVARLLAERRSNGEIARALFISPHTARHHTESVLQKLGVRARGEVRSALLALAGRGRPGPRRLSRAG